MANPKSKILPRIFSVFVIVLVFHCVDAFYPSFMGDISSFGTNVIGSVLGIATVFGFCIVEKRGTLSIALSLHPLDVLKGLLSGLIFMVLPLAVVLAGQVLLLFVIDTGSSGLSLVAPNGNIIIFAAACALTAFSRELFFRGYVIRSMRPIYPFFDANTVQAALSVSLPLMLIVRNFVYGHYTFDRILFIVAVVLFTVVNEFFGSIKRGLIARVDGNIWSSVFDNFFFMFLGYSLFVQTNIITTFAPLVRLLLAQGISFLIAVLHYKRQYERNKKQKEKAHEEMVRRHELVQQQEMEQQDDPNLEDISQRSVKDLVSDYNKQMIDSLGMHARYYHEEDENITDLNETKKQ